MSNPDINRAHYEIVYRAIDVGRIVERVENVDDFLNDATQTDTSWVGIFCSNFRSSLAGKRVLELGAGDGLLTLVMAALGATHVVAVDITQHTERAISEAASKLNLFDSVTVQIGDFRSLDLGSELFDLVVGKAFLHHLTHDEEDEYLARTAEVLTLNGEARFFEPAQNNLLLDELRWAIPVPGRPSSLNRKAFKEWKKLDPHPERDNSSSHYRRVGEKYFEQVQIVPLGGLERFHRILPSGSFNRKYRRFAFRVERFMPMALQSTLARSQTIIMRQPRIAIYR